MLLRLVSVISLIQFLLLMVSGESINTALYRSLLVFLILFSLVYLSIFLLNIIQASKAVSGKSAATEGGSQPQNKSDK
jgi:cell division protein FtsI/penicillin-binding protein 2